MEPSQTPDLEDAIEFAARVHRGQVRDGESPLPYITHPIDVLANLRYVGEITDPDLLCAAALHDVIEECCVQAKEIEERFGTGVRELVVELTRREPTEEERAGLTKDEIWKMRSEMLLQEISQMSSRAQTVKLADRLSNLNEAIRSKQDKKLKRYNAQTGEILAIIPKSVNPGLWEAIARLRKQID